MATQVDLKLLLYNKNFELIGTSDNIINNTGRIEIENLLPDTTYEQGQFYISWVVDGNEMSKVPVPTFKTLKYDTSHTLIVYFNDINKDNLQRMKGDSAYEVWLQQGNKGSVSDFFESLRGEKGKDANVRFVDLTEEQKNELKADASKDLINETIYVKGNYLTNIKDLFNKPPVGVDFNSYAESINDTYYKGITSQYSESLGKKVIAPAQKWFFYRVDTTNFKENTFSSLVQLVSNSNNTGKIEYRTINPQGTGSILKPFELLDEELQVYGIIGDSINKGDTLEIRFDNRGNSNDMVLWNPVIFEGSVPGISESSLVNLDYKLSNLNTKLETLDSTVTNLKNTINTLTSNQKNGKQQTESLQNDLEKLQEKSNAQYKRLLNLPILTPTNFKTKNHVMNNKIFKSNSNKFFVSVDIRDYKITGGKDYYVDTNNGNDSNNGLTKDNAFKTLKTAFANISDGDTLYIAGGNYFRTNGLLFPKPINKSINIIGETDNVNFYMGDTPTWTKTQNYNNIYEYSRTNVDTVINVMNNQPITKVDSLEELDKKSYAYYYDNSKVYVNQSGSEPNSNIVVMLSSSNLQINSITGDIYLENLNIYGGKSCAELDLTAKNNAYINNCTFNYAVYGYNGLTVIGGNNILVFSSTADSNGFDGFNYHIGKDGSLPFFVEYDCIGINNGNDKGTAGFKSNNGSTCHDGIQGIRINGIYARNDGGNVADVNTGTQTWNLGCTAFESYQGKDFQTSSGSDIFLDSCVAYGSTNSINSSDTNSTVYTRLGNYQNKLILGEEVAY